MRKKSSETTVSQRDWLRRLAAVAVIVAASALALPAVPANAVGRAPACASRGASFTNVLAPGECIVSSDNRFEVVMQLDGNLVEYNTATGRACWASSWGGHGFVAGDRAYLEVKTFPAGPIAFWYATLRVGHPYWGGIHQTYAITALQKLPIWQSPSYNVSINRAGELWVGYQRLSSAC